MMGHWHYVYADLRVTSELPIPEWATFEQPASFDDADVLIALDGAHPSTSLRMPSTSLRPAQDAPPAVSSYITSDEYRFHIPEAGDYWVRHGCEIIVAPAPDAGVREVRLFLLGSILGALLHQRGDRPLAELPQVMARLEQSAGYLRLATCDSLVDL